MVSSLGYRNGARPSGRALKIMKELRYIKELKERLKRGEKLESLQRPKAFLQERGPGGLPYQAEASTQPQLPQGPPAFSTIPPDQYGQSEARRFARWH